MEIPYICGGALLLTTVLFPIVEFTGAPEFFFYWLQSAVFLLKMTYFDMFLAFALPNIEVATGAGVLVMSIWLLFVGFNPPASAIPHANKWLYEITPHRYSLEALATIAFGNCNDAHASRVACKTLQHAPPTVHKGLRVTDFIDTFYPMTYDHVWRDFGVIVALTAIFALLALVSLRFVNHMKT